MTKLGILILISFLTIGGLTGQLNGNYCKQKNPIEI